MKVPPETKFDFYGEPCCGIGGPDEDGFYQPDSYWDDFDGPYNYPDRYAPGFKEWRAAKVRSQIEGTEPPPPFPFVTKY
jgi:hypothetical protein